MYDDKIEISNSGRLPPGLTVAQLVSGKYVSEPRNPQIAEMFKEAGIIERYGSGIGRIITDFKEYGLAAPEFAEVGSHFLVTVYKKRISGFVQGRVPEKVLEKLTPNQAKILAAVGSNPHVTIEVLSKLVGISGRKIRVNLAKLKGKNLIIRVGPDKGGHWEVVL